SRAGLTVAIESGAGLAAGFTDAGYAEQGAEVVATAADVAARADLMLRVRVSPPGTDAGRADLSLIRQGQALVAFLDPLNDPSISQALAGRGVVAFAMERVPPTPRAPSMDARALMATFAGYKAVMVAANTLPRMFPMLTTAAGTVKP